ncbi:MAG: TRAP transporter substrate-binding protein [Defluviitaleaceae bacterium]|nr:TRAP transporter substrate-binding protein [Defluviitaleaceae bacterium]
MKHLLKNAAAAVLAVGLAAGLGACTAPTAPATAPATGQAAGQEAPAEAERSVVRLAHGQPIESIAHVHMAQMADFVYEQSGGMLEIQIFPANQLGNERDLAEGMLMGTVDMTYISLGVWENFDSRLALFSLPFIFENYDHVLAVVESDLGDELFGSMSGDFGVSYLGFVDQGFRWIWNNDHPVYTLEDLGGMTLRVPESPAFISTFTLLGANATPIPWGELYTAMQTGVVAGFEVFPESIISNRMYEVTRYGSKSNHIFAASIITVRDEVLNGLPAEHQQLLRDAVRTYSGNIRSAVIADEQALIEQATANGMIINDISPEVMAQFAAAVEPLYEEYAERLGGMEIIERARNTPF